MPKIKTSELQKKLEETEAALKRALADYANLEKRVKAEREVIDKIALAKVVSAFLPVLENLDKASKHTEDSGILMVVKQFREVLRNLGIKEIGTVGETFNPKLHEALEVVEGENDGQIVEILASGFAIDGEVIQPAKVKVVKVKVEAEAVEKAEKAKEFGDYA